MPKVTFHNLTKEKQQILTEALIKEFSRVPLSEASISNIIKSANIPRGSFYQYFEDKEDAYFFLLTDQVIKTKNNFVSLLRDLDGDIFAAVTEFYAVVIQELAKGENINFLRNAFLNMTYEIEHTFNMIFQAHESHENIGEIGILINKDLLNVSTDMEMFHLMKIIATVTFRNLIEVVAKNLTVDEAMDGFQLDMELLQNGLKK